MKNQKSHLKHAHSDGDPTPLRKVLPFISIAVRPMTDGESRQFVKAIDALLGEMISQHLNFRSIKNETTKP